MNGLRDKLTKCEVEFEAIQKEVSNAEKNLDMLISDHSKRVNVIAEGMDSLFLNKQELDDIGKNRLESPNGENYNIFPMLPVLNSCIQLLHSIFPYKNWPYKKH